MSLGRSHRWEDEKSRWARPLWITDSPSVFLGWCLGSSGSSPRGEEGEPELELELLGRGAAQKRHVLGTELANNLNAGEGCKTHGCDG